MTICLPSDSTKEFATIAITDVAEWHELFQEAERRIKEIELHEGLDIPAINELRYVAFHLLEILNAADPSEKEAHKPKVKAHIQRATYDACEALISIQLKELMQFQEDYRLVVISEVVKNYQELMQQAEQAKSLIKGKQRGHDGREAYYADAMNHVQVLSGINTTLRAARDELNKKLLIQRRDSKRWAIGIAAAIIVAIIGLIAKLA